MAHVYIHYAKLFELIDALYEYHRARFVMFKTICNTVVLIPMNGCHCAAGRGGSLLPRLG